MKDQIPLPDSRTGAPGAGGGRAAFGGSIPREYQERLVPLLFQEYATDIVSRVGPVRGAVLETAAGTGVVSRRLRAALPAETALTVSDVSAEMLALARESLAGAAGVEFVAADATATPFGDGAFDAVVCQFGVMFFPDQAAGFREAFRVLRPGGRFVFSVWDDLASNPLPQCVHEAVASVSPRDPARFLEKPYRALDLTGMVRELQGAGFGEIRATVLPKVCRAPSGAAGVDAFLLGTPLGAQLAERGVAGEASAVARRMAAERFAGGDETAAIAVPMRAVVVEAMKN
ncbi:MAG TPA: methyltransferase domain-containing protein [Phycisphaerales bacterium]|nr:methyltransferase domain-containing protein [Phycisphaerales bacterium]